MGREILTIILVAGVVCFSATRGIAEPTEWPQRKGQSRIPQERYSSSAPDRNGNAAQVVAREMNQRFPKTPPLRLYSVWSPERRQKNYVALGGFFEEVNQVKGARFTPEEYETWYELVADRIPEVLKNEGFTVDESMSVMVLPQGVLVPIVNGKAFKGLAIGKGIPSLIDVANSIRQEINPEYQPARDDPDPNALRVEMLQNLGALPIAKIKEPQPLYDDPKLWVDHPNEPRMLDTKPIQIPPPASSARIRGAARDNE